MNEQPAIAVITPNVLMGIGMKAILEKIIPMADVELFRDFATFEEAQPEHFFHFFVTPQLFVAHSAFFHSQSHRTILLCSAKPQAFAGVPWIDIRTSEETIVRDILRMHHGAHPHQHDIGKTIHPASTALSGREIEVLSLVARGYMNKEIASHLRIGLTTVISHRRNIMEKLGIHSVAGLAIYAMTAGYVDADEL